MSSYATATERNKAAGIPSCAEPLDAMLLLYIVRHYELARSQPSWDDMCRASGSARALTAVKLRELRDAGLIVWQPEVGKGTLRPLVREVGVA